MNSEFNFDEIYVSYFPRMKRFAREYVLADADAENIVQDIFLHLWEKRDVFNVRISLSSYLLSLVKNRCVDFLRHRVVVDSYSNELGVKLLALQDVDHSFLSDENLEEILNNAINKLPEQCRVIFSKSRFEGKKYREIAEEMNLSVNTVENQMGIALKKLRVELKDYLPLLVFIL